MKEKYVKKVDPTVDYFDYNGIQVPFSTNQKIVLDGKETVPDKSYVYDLKSGNVKRAVISMLREALIWTIGEKACKVRGWDAPIAVSAAVPEGTITLDKRGIPILGEDWAAEHFIDADGDRCVIFRVGDRVVIVKWPITYVPLSATWNQAGVVEKFTGLTAEMATNLLATYRTKCESGYAIPGDGIDVEFGSNTPYNEKKFFIKGHGPSFTGRMTNGWNTFEAFECQSLRGINKKLDFFMKNGERKTQIEHGVQGMEGIKKVSKDAVKTTIAEIDVTNLPYAIAYENAWALTGTGRLASLSEEAIAWLSKLDEKGFKKVLTDISKLNLSFREKKTKEFERRLPVSRSQSCLKKLLPKRYVYNGEVVENTKNITQGGLIKFIEIGPAEPGRPSAVLVWLTRPDGTPVALTDVKRKEYDHEGLGYAYVLYPVWDNRTLYDNGKTGDQHPVASARKEWVHPIDHLEKCLKQFDTAVINPETREVVSYFPQSWDEWGYASRAGKIKRLQSFLTEYCGEYGDVVNCNMRNGRPELLPHNSPFIRSTAVIDYGGVDLDAEQMYQVAEEASAKWKLCIGGNKQTKMHVRKYCLATETGAPLWRPIGAECHPARLGKQRAQLVHALKEVKLRVAIVNCETLTQYFITPSGAEKQTIEAGFLPMCLNSLGDAEEYLNSLDDREKAEMPDNFLKGQEFTTWTGNKVTVWVVKPRNTVRIGKLVSTRGEKLEPRIIGEVIDLDEFDENMENRQIDLVIPVTELINKGAHTNMLEKCAEHMIHFKSYVHEDLTQLGNITIPAMVGEFIYYRTGAHSENTPPRWRTCRYKGIDGMVIMRQIEKLIGKEWIQEVNIGPALEMINAAKRIMKRHGIKLNSP